MFLKHLIPVNLNFTFRGHMSYVCLRNFIYIIGLKLMYLCFSNVLKEAVSYAYKK